MIELRVFDERDVYSCPCLVVRVVLKEMQKCFFLKLDSFCKEMNQSQYESKHSDKISQE